MRVTREGENRLKALSPMHSRTPASSSEISPFFVRNAPDTQGIFLFGISGMRLHSELYAWLLAEHTYGSMASTLPTCDALFFIAGDKRKPNLQVVIAHASNLCSQHLFGLQLIMNGIQITQFNHSLLNPLSLVIWSSVFWLSIMWNLREAQRWRKSVSLSPALRNLWLLIVLLESSIH